MEPEGHMKKASESDIHLEADIHALANNPNGIPEKEVVLAFAMVGIFVAALLI